jgi:phospholipid transport system transporter-binding protein
MSAELRHDGADQLTVCGEINAQTAVELLNQSKPRIAGDGRLTIDLAQVTRSDSTGVALLLEWMRMAARANREIHFANLPVQMRAIAEVCGVDHLLH